MYVHLLQKGGMFRPQTIIILFVQQANNYKQKDIKLFIFFNSETNDGYPIFLIVPVRGSLSFNKQYFTITNDVTLLFIFD